VTIFNKHSEADEGDPAWLFGG